VWCAARCIKTNSQSGVTSIGQFMGTCSNAEKRLILRPTAKPLLLSSLRVANPYGSQRNRWLGTDN
jgi:hypothetical protein